MNNKTFAPLCRVFLQSACVHDYSGSLISFHQSQLCGYWGIGLTLHLSLSQLGDHIVPKEVALLHNLKQKYIIRMLDYFEDRWKFYIVMERPEKYIDLFDYITQKGTVSERSSRYLFRQILEAVQYCLSMGVFHRDVKDENILIDLNSNQVKLIDFGSGTYLQDDVYTEYEGELRALSTSN